MEAKDRKKRKEEDLRDKNMQRGEKDREKIWRKIKQKKELEEEKNTAL